MMMFILNVKDTIPVLSIGLEGFAVNARKGTQSHSCPSYV